MKILIIVFPKFEKLILKFLWNHKQPQIAKTTLKKKRSGIFTVSNIKITSKWDLSGGTVVKNTCQCRGHGFDPWSRKIPYAMEQISPCATTTEPVCHNYWDRMLKLLKPVWLEPVLCNKKSHCNEKPMHCNEE